MKHRLKLTKDTIIQIFLTIITFVAYFYILNSYAQGQICIAPGMIIIVSFIFLTGCLALIVGAACGSIVIQSNWFKIFYCMFMPIAALFMEELLWNKQVLSLGMKNFVLNSILIMILYSGMVFVWRSHAAASITITALLWLYGMVNHYVLQFKGCPPSMGDFLAVKTAVSVAASYHLEMSDSVLYGSLIMLYLIVIAVWLQPQGKHFAKRRHKFLTSASGSIWLILVFSLSLNCNIQGMTGLSLSPWEPVVSFQENGAPLSLFFSAQNLKKSKPKNYSKKIAEKILAEPEKETNELIYNYPKPSVIVIMNESFADMSTFGTFECEEYLGNWNHISPYLMRGNTYTSVWSGGTCNTEFEFLTGNSMCNVNAGIYPYVTYDLSNSYNLVDIFNNQGYETIAFHPFMPDNWNRVQVYGDFFSFDQYVSIDDLENEQYISWGISDTCNYQKIIELYENSKNPLFLFNVTMQNHGGYDSPLRDDIELISIEKQYEPYEDVVNYLTLIRESDQAFAQLIDYFSAVAEPVVICMFGDHQPALNRAFTDSLLEKNTSAQTEPLSMKPYITPYIIWSNFEMETSMIAKNMSVNYLGANLLHLLGFDTAYSSYLLDLEKKIPAVTVNGYQTSDGLWHNSMEEHDVLKEYQIIQYYEMFEKK